MTDELVTERLKRRQEIRAWRDANRDYEIQRSRARTQDKAKNAIYNRQRKRTTEQMKAHQSVRKALRRGELVKPSTCSRCNGTGRLYAHHDDYGKPLNIVWLCQRCHGLRHREINDQRLMI